MVSADSPLGQPADAGALPVGHSRQVGAASQQLPVLHVDKRPRDCPRILCYKVLKLPPACAALKIQTMAWLVVNKVD